MKDRRDPGKKMMQDRNKDMFLLSKCNVLFFVAGLCMELWIRIHFLRSTAVILNADPYFALHNFGVNLVLFKLI